MAVGGPTAADPEFPHDGKGMRISQGQVLVSEPLYDTARLGQFRSIEPSGGQSRQRMNDREELNGPVLVKAPEKPSVPSAASSADVHIGGGAEKRRKNSAWKLSERFRKAMKADVST